MNTPLQWQGEDVSVKYGYCEVTTDNERPLCWYNYHCRQNGKAKLHAILIEQNGNTWCIYNGFAIGWFKLSKGGWPNEGHASLPTDGFVEDESYKIEKYDQDGFRIERELANDWEKNTHPEEWRKKIALLQMANKFK